MTIYEKITRANVPGDKVKHRGQTGVIDWVSPTRGTMRIKHDDGTCGYAYPEQDGTPPRVRVHQHTDTVIAPLSDDTLDLIES